MSEFLQRKTRKDKMTRNMYSRKLSRIDREAESELQSDFKGDLSVIESERESGGNIREERGELSWIDGVCA